MRAILIILMVAVWLLSSACLGPQRASFSTEDGGVVYADIYGEGDHAVVLAHGGRFTKESWSEQAREIAAAGFLVLAFDFRGRGLSRGGPGDPEGEKVHLDVAAAVDFLSGSGASTVSVVGASFGGWAASKAAVESPDSIDRLVLLAAPADDPARLTCPTLFILARDDFMGEGTLRLPEIREDYEQCTGPADLVLLEGSAHAQFLFDTDQEDRLMAEILRFLTAKDPLSG